MKQFRIVLKGRNKSKCIVSEWFNCSDWTLQDMEQFKELGNYYIEYRG